MNMPVELSIQSQVRIAARHVAIRVGLHPRFNLNNFQVAGVVEPARERVVKDTGMSAQEHVPRMSLGTGQHSMMCRAAGRMPIAMA